MSAKTKGRRKNEQLAEQSTLSFRTYQDLTEQGSLSDHVSPLCSSTTTSAELWKTETSKHVKISAMSENKARFPLEILPECQTFYEIFNKTLTSLGFTQIYLLMFHDISFFDFSMTFHHFPWLKRYPFHFPFVFSNIFFSSNFFMVLKF